MSSCADPRLAWACSWTGRFFAIDQPASSTLTRERFGWTPTHPGLVEDLEAGRYFGR